MDNVVEIYNQGYHYYSGTNGYPMNYRLALQRFTEAAALAHGPAMNYLGLMYEYGKGVPEDLHQAVCWYQKAADQGDAFGLYNLARQYYEGRSVPQDREFALKLYQEAYARGNHHAGFHVGNHLLEQRRIKAAFQAYKNAASSGNHGPAWHQVGYMIETYPELTGLEKTARMQKALPCYKKAAEAGVPVGMYMFGQRLFHLGLHSEGVQWVKKAAEAGLPEAQKLYRLMRFTGK